MTDRIGDILRNHIADIKKRLELIEAGIDVVGDNPDQMSRYEELSKDLAAVSANLDSLLAFQSRR